MSLWFLLLVMLQVPFFVWNSDAARPWPFKPLFSTSPAMHIVLDSVDTPCGVWSACRTSCLAYTKDGRDSRLINSSNFRGIY